MSDPPTVALVPLDQFAPQAQNANQHTERGLWALETSIQADGWIGALTVAADGETFDGSARLEKTVGVGVDEAIVIETDGTRPVIIKRTDIPTATDPRAVRLGLAANRIAQLNLAWDSGVLATLDPPLLEGLWTEPEREAFRALPSPGAGGDDFDSAPSEGVTIAQPGDIWQAGDHLLCCLDSTDPVAVAQAVGALVPTFVWSDGPYGIDIVDVKGFVGGTAAYDIPFGGVKKARGDVGGGAAHMRKTGRPYIADRGLGSADGAKPFGSKAARGTVGAANMVDVGLYAPVIGDDSTDTVTAAFALHYSLYPNARHIWWGANHYSTVLPASSCWIVWDKENTGNFADAELAWCNDKSAVRIFRHMWNGLMKASERGEKRVHPTQKPVALAQWAFGKYGASGDVIIDPFLGSGISLIAAHRLGDKRRVVGFELAPAYIDVCIRRWEAETGERAIRLATKELANAG